jgi:hypothetical protein
VYVWKVSGLEVEVITDGAEIDELVAGRVAAAGAGGAEMAAGLKMKLNAGAEGLKGRKLVVVMYGMCAKTSAQGGGEAGEVASAQQLEALRIRLLAEKNAYGNLLKNAPKIDWEKGFELLRIQTECSQSPLLVDLGAIIYEFDSRFFQQAEWLETTMPTLLGVPLPPAIIHHFKRVWEEVKWIEEFNCKGYPFSVRTFGCLLTFQDQKFTLQWGTYKQETTHREEVRFLHRLSQDSLLKGGPKLTTLVTKLKAHFNEWHSQGGVAAGEEARNSFWSDIQIKICQLYEALRMEDVNSFIKDVEKFGNILLDDPTDAALAAGGSDVESWKAKASQDTSDRIRESKAEWKAFGGTLDEALVARAKSVATRLLETLHSDISEDGVTTKKKLKANSTGILKKWKETVDFGTQIQAKLRRDEVSDQAFIINLRSPKDQTQDTQKLLISHCHALECELKKHRDQRFDRFSRLGCVKEMGDGLKTEFRVCVDNAVKKAEERNKAIAAHKNFLDGSPPSWFQNLTPTELLLCDEGVYNRLSDAFRTGRHPKGVDIDAFADVVHGSATPFFRLAHHVPLKITAKSTELGAKSFVCHLVRTAAGGDPTAQDCCGEAAERTVNAVSSPP